MTGICQYLDKAGGKLATIPLFKIMKLFYKDHHTQFYFCDLFVETIPIFGIKMSYVKGNIKVPTYSTKSAPSRVWLLA